jgi:hypothetical protein
MFEQAEGVANATDWRNERGPIGAALSKGPKALGSQR